jgi:SAM-dependent methyltransferase
MKIFHAIMARRAQHLAGRLAPFLPHEGKVLDIGCGTGHNAAALELARPGLEVQGLDVVDISALGPGPAIFDGQNLPFPDGAFDACLLLFVLHLPSDPAALLHEARRVTDRLLVVQSTYRGPLARSALVLRGLIQGRAALGLSRRIGLVKDGPDPLQTKQYWERDRLEELFGRCGWQVAELRPEPWPLAPWLELSRDLYLLRPS